MFIFYKQEITGSAMLLRRTNYMQTEKLKIYL